MRASAAPCQCPLVERYAALFNLSDEIVQMLFMSCLFCMPVCVCLWPTSSTDTLVLVKHLFILTEWRSASDYTQRAKICFIYHNIWCLMMDCMSLHRVLHPPSNVFCSCLDYSANILCIREFKVLSSLSWSLIKVVGDFNIKNLDPLQQLYWHIATKQNNVLVSISHVTEVTGET